MNDDLLILGQSLEASLELDFVYVKFKNGYETVYTRVADIAGECDINIIDSPNNVPAYNVIKERWENLDLSTIDMAESQEVID